MLTALNKKKKILVLGINSGTSIDSVDFAVCSIGRSKQSLNFSFITGYSRKFPPKLHRRLHEAAECDKISLNDLVRLDNALGLFIGRAASSVVKQMKSRNIRIELISSHGQTIRHLPHKERMAEFSCAGSLQIGSPAMIAAAANLPVVADFRQGAIALGHEGAPITTTAMRDLFADPIESRLIANIGGMSNYFYFPAGRGIKISARDCGPGNSLSDLLCQKLLRTAYDKGGRIARSGEVSEKLLRYILRASFFSTKKISTGREEFGNELAEKLIRQGRALRLSKSDMVATAAEATVLSIARRIKPIAKRDRRLTKLYLTGGGRKNRFITDRLALVLPELEIGAIDLLQFDGDYVEAAAYALMGEKAVRGIASDIFFDGAPRDKRAVLGTIVQPPPTIKKR